jgi:hypothetical protein
VRVANGHGASWGRVLSGGRGGIDEEKLGECPCCPQAACPQTNSGVDANRRWHNTARAEGAAVKVGKQWRPGQQGGVGHAGQDDLSRSGCPSGEAHAW